MGLDYSVLSHIAFGGGLLPTLLYSNYIYSPDRDICMSSWGFSFPVSSSHCPTRGQALFRGEKDVIHLDGICHKKLGKHKTFHSHEPSIQNTNTKIKGGLWVWVRFPKSKD